MPAKATVSDIISRALDYCDIPSSSAWVTQNRLIDIVNDGLSDLHYRIAMAFEDYLTELQEYDVRAGEEAIPLPSDFFKLVSLYLINGGTRYKMERYRWQDMHVSPTTITTSHPRYRVIGQHIRFFPAMMGTYSVELWYVRQFRDLASTDELDPSLPHGWDCYVMGHVAEYLLQRKEADPTPAAKYKAEAWEMISSAIAERDAGGPKTVIDTTGRYRVKRVLPIPVKP